MKRAGVWLVGLGLVAVLVSLFRVYRIGGTSMNYGLVERDIVIATTRIGSIRRGDLVVIRHPDDPKQRLYIKRCVALAGDRYQIKDRLFYLQIEHNTTRTAEMARRFGLRAVMTPEGLYLKEPMRSYYGIVHNPDLTLPKAMTDHLPETIPEGHFYTMGDYRDNSADSRIYGAVPRSWIIARIIAILKWPRSWEELITIKEVDE